MRVSLTIPDEVIAEIDAIVGPRGRSKFLTEAAVTWLNRHDFLQVALAAGGSLKDVDIPGWETSESAAAWVHHIRYHPSEPFVPTAEGEAKCGEYHGQRP